jgi:hypothetical protein
MTKRIILPPKPFRSKNKLDFVRYKINVLKIFDNLTKDKRQRKEEDHLCTLFVCYLLKLSDIPTIDSAIKYMKFDDWFYWNLKTITNLKPRHVKIINFFVDMLNELKNKYNNDLNTNLYRHDEIDVIFSSLDDIKYAIRILKNIIRKLKLHT